VRPGARRKKEGKTVRVSQESRGAGGREGGREGKEGKVGEEIMVRREEAGGTVLEAGRERATPPSLPVPIGTYII
jgi:hypothetical protein